jgi:alkylation response protein AidB-like acyl-CoA dehydrogenase
MLEPILLLLYSHGSDELREMFLAPSIAGDLVGCIGVSEPSAGSDVAGNIRVLCLYTTACHMC